MTVTGGPLEARWLEPWSPAEGAATAQALLVATWSSPARFTASAPGCVTIIGDHTDLGAGVCLPTVTPHRAFVAAAVRTDDAVRVCLDHRLVPHGQPQTWEGTLDTLAPALESTQWYAHPLAVIWEMLERGYVGTGLDLAITSCVPQDSGLSPHAAIAVATAMAVNDAWGLALHTGLDGIELADLCVDAANSIAEWASGGKSEHSIVRCTEGQALHLDFAERPPAAIPCPLYFPDYGLALLLTLTGSPSRRIGGVIAERMAEVARAADALNVGTLRELQDSRDGLASIEGLEDPVLRRRARHIFTENERVALVRDELSGTAPAHERFISVGKAMFRSHASLELDFEVSSSGLNLAVDTAFRNGALGARMVGAGLGGAAVALVRRSSAPALARDISAQFAAVGLAAPEFVLI